MENESIADTVKRERIINVIGGKKYIHVFKPSIYSRTKKTLLKDWNSA
jgi:hypothetical protein